MIKKHSVVVNGRALELGEKTCVMGILNVTPDSFSDGGRFHALEKATAHAVAMEAAGAGIIDIGGESTRPFAQPVDEAEELRRVIPVIEKLSGLLTVPISIDTTKASVARAALKAGAAVINDISSFEIDPAMSDVAAESGAPVMLMHMKGTPRTMQVNPSYGDLVSEIRDYLALAVERAVGGGIKRSKLIIDPGIGFGKTVTHNMALINRLHEFNALDLPILVGSSRKSFIAKTLGKSGIESPEAVETGTQATVAAAILRGAHIVRVHDVPSAVAAAAIMDPLKRT